MPGKGTVHGLVDEHTYYIAEAIKPNTVERGKRWWWKMLANPQKTVG